MKSKEEEKKRKEKVFLVALLVTTNHKLNLWFRLPIGIGKPVHLLPSQSCIYSSNLQVDGTGFNATLATTTPVCIR